MDTQNAQTNCPTVIRHKEPGDITREAALELGLDPITAKVLANRAEHSGVEPEWLMEKSIGELDPPFDLPDIKRASERIASAIIDGEVIAIETDHDVDGTTAHAVIYRALTEYFNHPDERIRQFIGLRLQEGYGISDSLCDRMLNDNPRASLVITADNGSSDAPRLERLAAAGIDVVVSDHHLMPADGVPAAAYACVSPAREDSAYPDGGIAGVMVAWLMMCAVRRALEAAGYLKRDNTLRFAALLDYVALGTVADCVSLGQSRNNRIVVERGLKLINAAKRPCWRAIREYLGDPSKALSAEDLAFGLAPRVNAQGRLDDAMTAVDFFLAENESAAQSGAKALDQANQQRREIERTLRDQALFVAEAQVEIGRKALVIPLADGHPGVHGIVASRVVEAYARPVVCFSEKRGTSGVLTGSCRGIEGAHIRDALAVVAEIHPEIMHAFGGHEGAGGVTIEADGLQAFDRVFQQAIEAQLGSTPLQRIIEVDAEISAPELFDLATIDDLSALEPFGRGFERPRFIATLRVVNAKEIGQEGGHWKITLRAENRTLEGIWFGVGSSLPIEIGGDARFVFDLQANHWQGKRRLQLGIKHAEAVSR
mgnify:FL=1